MNTSRSASFSRLLYRSIACLAALLVAAAAFAQSTTAPVLSVIGKLAHTTGPVFRSQLELAAGSAAATSYAKVGGDAAFAVDSATGVVTALSLFPGPATVSVTATNAAGTSAPTTLTVDVSPPGPESTDTATVGVPYSFLLLGPPGSQSYTASALPPGLSLTAPATVAPVVSSATSINGLVGAAFTYAITASGSPTSYRLRSGPGFLAFSPATGTITGTPTAVGTYTFRVSAANAAGSSTTVPVTFTVGPASVTPAGPYLSNLAIRSNAGSGAQTLIVGFVIGGTGTTGPKNVLLRGVGPALAGFGVPGVLADPQLALFAPGSPTAIGGNENWDSAATPLATQAAAGAFALTPGSKDAAIVGNGLPADSTTVHLTGVGGTTGVALVEIYELP